MKHHHGYHWLIDSFVEIASSSVIADRIRKFGSSVQANNTASAPLSDEAAEEREFFEALSPKSREVVARLIENARRSAVHDIAAFLEAEVSIEKLSISVDGERLEDSPYASYNFDFTARFEGDQWPDHD